MTSARGKPRHVLVRGPRHLRAHLAHHPVSHFCGIEGNCGSRCRRQHRPAPVLRALLLGHREAAVRADQTGALHAEFSGERHGQHAVPGGLISVTTKTARTGLWDHQRTSTASRTLLMASWSARTVRRAGSTALSGNIHALAARPGCGLSQSRSALGCWARRSRCASRRSPVCAGPGARRGIPGSRGALRGRSRVRTHDMGRLTGCRKPSSFVQGGVTLMP